MALIVTLSGSTARTPLRWDTSEESPATRDACPENDAGCHSERVGKPTPMTASLQRRVSVPGFARFFAVLAGLRKVRDWTAQNDIFMRRGADPGMW